jgi:hypothetical protein
VLPCRRALESQPDLAVVDIPLRRQYACVRALLQLGASSFTGLRKKSVQIKWHTALIDVAAAWRTVLLQPGQPSTIPGAVCDTSCSGSHWPSDFRAHAVLPYCNQHAIMQQLVVLNSSPGTVPNY